VRAVLEDVRTAPIPEAEKVLLLFLEKVNRAAATIRPGDVDAVKAAGWTEEAIYDAINVCALFNFYNRWNDAAGTADMSAAAYAMSGKRLASGGYEPK
jgi:alkylhydroperoxidase family enzyme